MVADQFISFTQKFRIGRAANLNDYADKFNYLLMPIVLVIFGSLTTLRQYVFQPIVCQAATTPYSTNFPDYINNLCWLEGTYANVDFEADATLGINEAYWAKQRKSLYYQWVPFTLALQAIMFFLPRLMWLAYVHNRAGPDLEALLESAAEANKAVDWKLRESIINGISRSIDYMLRMRETLGPTLLHDGYESHRSSTRQCLARRPPGCLSLIYALVKLMFLVNALSQMYIMGLLLDPDSPDPFLFGFRLITALRNGYDWRATRYFPRLTLCRVLIRHVGGNNMYAGQCVLPLNMLNEKIYCFLWVASAVGAGLSCLSLFQWALRLTCGRGRWRHHIRRYLLIGTECSLQQQNRCAYDFADHLHTDGLFLVHMIRLNVGELIACDVTNSLFRIWRERMYAEKQLPAAGEANADVAADAKLEMENPDAGPQYRLRKM